MREEDIAYWEFINALWEEMQATSDWMPDDDEAIRRAETEKEMRTFCDILFD